MNQKLPQHIAVVMDGNGRWAEHRGFERVEGHRAGVDAVKIIIECCLQKKIPVLSLFAFSSENWTRPVLEVDFLMQLFLQALMKEVQTLHQEGVRLRFIGNREALSQELCCEMDRAEQLTSDNQRLILNFALNYGGKWDILQAAKRLATEVIAGRMDLEAIDEACFENMLSTGNLPSPDLFIRTSGEQRVSNFFLWQLAYTELYFSPVYWPDFTADEFDKALLSFCSRQRRYGQLGERGYDV